MVVTVIGQNVAARSEGSPTNPSSLQLVNDRRGLFFSLRSDHPVNRTAYAQARQLSETPTAFRAHPEPCADFLDRFIPLFELSFVHR
jgi:hypothetical protein